MVPKDLELRFSHFWNTPSWGYSGPPESVPALGPNVYSSIGYKGFTLVKMSTKLREPALSC